MMKMEVEQATKQVVEVERVQEDRQQNKGRKLKLSRKLSKQQNKSRK
jgi:hypothetical protein